MQIVDSHCHINFEELSQRLPNVLENARLNDISHMLCVSVNIEDFPQVKKIADDHEHIFASVGVHPCYEDVIEPSVDELVAIAQNHNITATVCTIPRPTNSFTCRLVRWAARMGRIIGIRNTSPKA